MSGQESVARPAVEEIHHDRGVAQQRVDRVAVELNCQLVPRERWGITQLSDDDKLEIVHFVGGGV